MIKFKPIDNLLGYSDLTIAVDFEDFDARSQEAERIIDHLLDSQMVSLKYEIRDACI